MIDEFVVELQEFVASLYYKWCIRIFRIWRSKAVFQKQKY